MRLMSVICHLSSLTSADNVKCQMSAMADDRNNLHQYGCLQNRLCKCSNLVEEIDWTNMWEMRANIFRFIFSFVYILDFLYKMKTKKWSYNLIFFLLIWHRHNIPQVVFDIGGLFRLWDTLVNKSHIGWISVKIARCTTGTKGFS